MPVPLRVRLILYGLFGDTALGRAVAHWLVSQGDATLREVAREFGLTHTTLGRAVRRARGRIAEAARAEGVEPVDLLRERRA